MTSQLTNDLHKLFYVFSQKLLIVETPLKTFLEDINKVLSIKTTLQLLLN